MTSYFEDFKKEMKQRFRIPKSLVETCAKDILFLVDTNYTYAQAIMSRVRWLKALPYEVNIDETSTAITAILSEEIDNNAIYFGTFDKAKEIITANLQTKKVVKKKSKIIKKLIDQFGEDGEKEEEKDEEKSENPLLLTQG